MMIKKRFHKGQVNLEFASALVALVILVFGTAKIFVWMGNNYIDRHKAYEKTRKAQWEWFTMPGYPVSPVVTDFYNQSDNPLHIFSK